MLKNTREVLEKVKAEKLNTQASMSCWYDMFDAYQRNHEPYAISWSTFRKYATLEPVDYYEPYTFEDLVDIINSGYCEGYELVIRDGVAYDHYVQYKLVAINLDD